MKLNWGKSLAIVMFLFMIFILSFVYKSFTNKKYEHHLVSKEYYKDEMNFQQEINAIANAKKLKTNIKIKKTEKGLLFVFPSEFSKITGKIKLQRPATDKSDINLPIKLIDNKILITDEKLIDGLYNIRIDWTANNVKYLLKDKQFY